MSVLESSFPTIEFDFRKEIIRKSIHFSSLSIPLSYWFLFSKETLVSILLFFMLFSVVTDISRIYNSTFAKFYNTLFRSILREHELLQKKKNFTGATYVLISAVICFWLFPKVIAVTSFSILIVSDSASALFGRKFGKHKFKKIAGGKKSWEGTIAFVLSALVVILLTPKVQYTVPEYVIGFVAAIGGAISELLSFDIFDDNFAIPLATGLLMWLMYVAFLPELHINSF